MDIHKTRPLSSSLRFSCALTCAYTPAHVLHVPLDALVALDPVDTEAGERSELHPAFVRAGGAHEEAVSLLSPLNRKQTRNEVNKGLPFLLPLGFPIGKGPPVVVGSLALTCALLSPPITHKIPLQLHRGNNDLLLQYLSHTLSRPSSQPYQVKTLLPRYIYTMKMSSWPRRQRSFAPTPFLAPFLTPPPYPTR